MDTPGNAASVVVSGTIAYVADGSSGLHVIDASDPANPMILGSVDTPGSSNGVAISGTVAYVTDSRSSGLQVIDVSDPANPAIIGSVSTPLGADCIALSGTVAYVTGFFGLQVIDVSLCPAPCPADTDDDGNVGILDFLAVLAQWGQVCPCTADTDDDGNVGILDFLKVLADWGACPKASAQNPQSARNKCREAHCEGVPRSHACHPITPSLRRLHHRHDARAEVGGNGFAALDDVNPRRIAPAGQAQAPGAAAPVVSES